MFFFLLSNLFGCHLVFLIKRHHRATDVLLVLSNKPSLQRYKVTFYRI